MLGPDGALARARDGAIIIDLSTVSPGASRRLYDAARERGADMPDAAASGSVPQVELGSLAIFVGGEPEPYQRCRPLPGVLGWSRGTRARPSRTYQRCRPLLGALGERIFHMGPSGMGTTMKLVANTLLGLGMQALAEAIALGEKAGLEKSLLLDVLEQKGKLVNVARERYPTRFARPVTRTVFRL